MSRLYINVNDKKNTINRNIYGHFAEHLGRCIYEGIYVGEDSDIPNVNGMRTDVVEALKNIKIPVLRWPGGCFADEYHWKDGIGPKSERKHMINTHWGGVVEDNSFGTHEFMELCRQLDCEPYICGNVGSGTVQEMSEWVEYITFDGLSPMSELRAKNGQKDAWKIKYWGVGNENWGCGGSMRPEFYADLYRQYQTYVRNYGDNKLYKIACGPRAADYDWTEKVMQIAGRYMHAFALHYYTRTSLVVGERGSAIDFDENEYFHIVKNALFIEELIVRHLEIMNKYDPEHKVDMIIDEWGTWFNVEPGTNPGFLYQQNAMRDAIVAAVSLNIFNNHSNRIVMTNIAQTINVLQAVILTEGSKMLLTPTYHVFDLFKHHQDATLVSSFIKTETIGTEEHKVPNVNVSSSVDSNGVLNVTIANTSLDTSIPLEIVTEGMNAKSVNAEVLTGAMRDHNDFSNPDKVKPAKLKADISDGCVKLTLPACSVSLVQIS